MTAPPERPDLSSVPLFPLPNVVLFPRAVLPLHIFEERYKQMTADALAGDRQVAMALLKPGWERDYYHRPAIEPVVCVGTILSHEKLSDGKYNFLLQGHTRARVVREFDFDPNAQPYRLARLEPIRETNDLEIDLDSERQRLDRIFRPATLGGTPVGRQFRQLLSGCLRTADVADLVAFNYVEDIALKQSLLEESDVRRRVRRIVEAVEESQPSLQLAYLREAGDPEMN
jgi:Lon protease-like protein